MSDDQPKNQELHRKSALLASDFLYYFGRKSTVVKKPFFIFLLCHTMHTLRAQPLADTGSIIPQKENIIKASTIIRTENLGPNINTSLAELRPTVSPDGNLLFFIVENDLMNTKYNSIPNSQDIWFAERDSFGTWGPARHAGYPLNTYFYY